LQDDGNEAGATARISGAVAMNRNQVGADSPALAAGGAGGLNAGRPVSGPPNDERLDVNQQHGTDIDDF